MRKKDSEEPQSVPETQRISHLGQDDRSRLDSLAISKDNPRGSGLHADQTAPWIFLEPPRRLVCLLSSLPVQGTTTELDIDAKRLVLGCNAVFCLGPAPTWAAGTPNTR